MVKSRASANGVGIAILVIFLALISTFIVPNIFNKVDGDRTVVKSQNVGNDQTINTQIISQINDFEPQNQRVNITITDRKTFENKTITLDENEEREIEFSNGKISVKFLYNSGDNRVTIAYIFSTDYHFSQNETVFLNLQKPLLMIVVIFIVLGSVTALTQ